MKKLVTLFLTLLLLIFAAPSIAADITIAWDANPPAEQVTNYKVDWGTTSRINNPSFTGYNFTTDVGNFLQHTITNLADGTYYVAARAQNGAGLISDYSIELTVVIDTPANVPPGAPANFRLITITYTPGQ